MVGRGRAGAGEVEARHRCEVCEDGAHDSRILDGGDDTPPTATAGTSETEHEAYQARPTSTRLSDDLGVGTAGGPIAYTADEPS